MDRYFNLGRMHEAHAFINDSDDYDKATDVIDWVQEKAQVIRAQAPALWMSLFHRLDFSFPNYGVDGALNSIREALQEDSDDVINALDATRDVADLLISFEE